MSMTYFKHSFIFAVKVKWGKIWGFHGGEDSSRGLQDCDAVQCCGTTPTFRRSMLSPASLWRWREHRPSKHWHTMYHNTTRHRNPEDLDLTSQMKYFARPPCYFKSYTNKRTTLTKVIYFRNSIPIYHFRAHRVQTGSGAHPASYPIAPGTLSLGVKREGREADHSPPSSSEVKKYVELSLHSPNTYSCHGA
jgi:hypothetical protein